MPYVTENNPQGTLIEGSKPPISIAIYTRKSNDENLNGAVTSIDNQKTCCRSYIAIQREKGWREYPEVFDDPAESGKSFKRPAVQRLLKSIEEGKIQGVIVYKLDRMTRNSRDFHILLELFEKHNVAFISATESIDTKSPQGRLMTAIMVQFAQYDRELDQERSKDFHLARARKGLWCAGLPPLGYDLKDKLLTINEEEAKVVRRIFELYLTLKSTILVARELNRLGFQRKIYHTKNGQPFGGKPFDINSVIRILRRKVYIGIITNGRTNQEFPGQQQSIVSLQVFESTQRLLESHKRREGRGDYGINKHGFLLKGLARCGECHSVLLGYAQPKGKKIYRYYKCRAKAGGMPIHCAFKSVPAPELEKSVTAELLNIGGHRSLAEMIAKKVREKSKSGIAPLETEKRDTDERSRRIRQNAQNILELVKIRGASQEAAEELQRLEFSRKELEVLATELEDRIGRKRRALYNPNAVPGALNRFCEFIFSLPISSQICVIQLLVKQVTVFKTRANIEFHELPKIDFKLEPELRLTT